jgi:hypothetical protein
MSRRIASPGAPLVRQPVVAMAFDEFKNARVARRQPGDERTEKAANRRTYAALSNLCRVYFEQAVTHNPSSLEIFPPEAAQVIHNVLESLLSRNLDQGLRDLIFRDGTPAHHPAVKLDIEAACRYAQAVNNGLIDDKAPIQKLADWYGVSRPAAQKWVRDEKRDLVTSFYPDAADEDRAHIIRNKAQQRGARHTVHGRGQRAIAGRAIKRRPLANH